MQEAASEILTARSGEHDELRRTGVVSLAAHLVLIALVLLAPTDWMADSAVDPAVDVMTIRLGGPEGPGEGGRTALGGRPIQDVVTAPEIRRPQWIQPPTAAPPRMILPVPEAVPARRPEPEVEVETAPAEARGRTPTRGPEALEGSTMADTGVQGTGVGLSGGGLGGDGAELDVGDFCCPLYLSTMIELIRRRWDNNQRVPGSVVVRFIIERSGAIDDVGVDRSSGYLALDMSAQRAVMLTRALPPLPAAYPDDDLPVRLTFEYQP